MTTFSIRDKAILTGLYFSKYDAEALAALDFQSFQEACNVLGYSIGSKPSSLKNYRDEFDPLFPNSRKGWHKRPIRDYCKRFYDEFSSLDFNSFTDLVKSSVIPNYEIEKIVNQIEKKSQSESVAKRLLTGKAAEEYFRVNYKAIPDFVSYQILDATSLACGFDFRLSFDDAFYFVEVKGLNQKKGSVTLTEKEFMVAKEFKSQFCLFVVTNFAERPDHQLFFDPLNCRLTFKMTQRQVLQTNYIAAL